MYCCSPYRGKTYCRYNALLSAETDDDRKSYRRCPGRVVVQLHEACDGPKSRAIEIASPLTLEIIVFFVMSCCRPCLPCSAVNMRHEVAFQVAHSSRTWQQKDFSLTGGLDSCPCLVLNADYQPLSYLPLRYEYVQVTVALQVDISQASWWEVSVDFYTARYRNFSIRCFLTM